MATSASPRRRKRGKEDGEKVRGENGLSSYPCPSVDKDDAEVHREGWRDSQCSPRKKVVGERGSEGRWNLALLTRCQVVGNTSLVATLARVGVDGSGDDVGLDSRREGICIERGEKREKKEGCN